MRYSLIVLAALLTACQSSPQPTARPAPTDSDFADSVSLLQYASRGACNELDSKMSGLDGEACEQRKDDAVTYCAEQAREPVKVLSVATDPDALVIGRFTFCYTSTMKSQSFDVQQFDRWFIKKLIETRAQESGD